MTARVVRIVDDLGDDKRAIIDAAVRCFERYGPQRTSMGDIAEEAGISRRTLYRVFDDRSSLIEEILHRRLVDMGDTVRARLDTYGDIEEALIEGSLFSVEVAERDELFSEILTHAHSRSVERFLLRGNETVRSALVEAWSPVLDQGRAARRIRHDLSDGRIVELIVTVQAIVLMRDDLNQHGRRELLGDLLVPAILRTPSESP